MKFESEQEYIAYLNLVLREGIKEFQDRPLSEVRVPLRKKLIEIVKSTLEEVATLPDSAIESFVDYAIAVGLEAERTPTEDLEPIEPFPAPAIDKSKLN